MREHSRGMADLRKQTDMAKSICTFEGCSKTVQGNGYCPTHNWRYKKYGDPSKTVRIFGDDVTRFWSKVNKDGPLPERRPELGPCWVWTGSTVRGYGSFRVERGTRSAIAHRWGYEQFVGPIPEGLHIDHLCRNHSCVRLDHLEPVTPAENLWRGDSPTARVRRTGRCTKGHSMDDAYQMADGTRACRTCCLEKAKAEYRNPDSARYRLKRPRKYRQLTQDQVVQIKSLVAAGAVQRVVAEQFGCSQATISAIVNGRRKRNGVPPLA